MAVTFSQLWLNYPIGKRDKVKKEIGGRVDAEWIANTCAIRMSSAFNKSGIKIQKSAILHTISGGDGMQYAFRVKEFRQYLKSKFGNPTFIFERTGKNKLSKRLIKGKKGILVHDVREWSDASGHVTLWNGSRCIRKENYFGLSTKIELWEIG